MAGFTIYQSTKLELLSDKFSQIIKKRKKFPLAKDYILINSAGMQKWLSLKVSSKNRIFTSASFLFPEQLTTLLYESISGEKRKKSPFNAESLKWTVFEILSHPENFSPAKYFNKYTENDSIKTAQLSIKIADLFDQYTIFRPEMIEKWEKGKLLYKNDKNEKHQAALWQEIKKKSESAFMDRSKLLNFIDKNIESASKNGLLPFETLCIFGVSILPPYHVELLKIISKYINVVAFLLNPSDEYWGDADSDKEKLKKGIEDNNNNKLLENMGMAGKYFFDSLTELESSGEILVAEKNKTETTLESIQNDIESFSETILNTKTADDSIKFISCPGPMREMEVLFNNLLKNMENGLKPHEIAVMAPDISFYAPYINAVLGTCEPHLAIPYTIADLSPQNESGITKIFLAICDMAEKEFQPEELINIFEYRNVLPAFKLKEKDVHILREWIKDAGIRRNITPSISEISGTWETGIKRMLLGYSFDDENYKIEPSFFPYDQIEGLEASILGSFLDFYETFTEFRKRTFTEKQLPQWIEILNSLIDRIFIKNDETLREISYLETMLASFTEEAETSKFSSFISFAALKEFIKKYTSAESTGSGFISGGVTFCSMKPLRAVPFKIIYLLGINNDSFPRKQHKPSFDLISSHPKKGDRNSRESDRYLFLETFMSAREKLYISYNGKNVNDGTESLPSPLAEEVKDYIKNKYEKEDINLTEIHPLQAFDKKYFMKNSPLFTYLNENEPGFEEKEIVFEHPAKIPEDLTNITGKTFAEMFTDPAKFFLCSRLGLKKDYEEKPFPKYEIFKMDPLDTYSLKQNFLDRISKGLTINTLYGKLKLDSKIPYGASGKTVVKKTFESMGLMLDTLVRYQSGTESKIKLGNLTLGNDEKITVSGFIENIYETGLVMTRPTKKPKEKDIIKLWIYHLLVNQEREMKSFFIAEERVVSFKPIQKFQAIQELNNLASLYLDGCRDYLLFHPKYSGVAAKELVIFKKDNEVIVNAIERSGQFLRDYEKEFGWERVKKEKGLFKKTDSTTLFLSIAETIYRPLLKYVTIFNMKKGVEEKIWRLFQ